MTDIRNALLAAILAAGLTAWAREAAAAPFTAPEAIDREVAGFTGAAIGQPGGAMLPVDRRLKLAPCASPLSLGWRADRHDAVVVQCPDPGSWRVYVAVQTVAAASTAPAVLRGEGLSLVVGGDGFSVSQPAEAMDAGAVGDWIRVRAVREGTARGEPLRARIVRPGLAEVPMP